MGHWGRRMYLEESWHESVEHGVLEVFQWQGLEESLGEGLSESTFPECGPGHAGRGRTLPRGPHGVGFSACSCKRAAMPVSLLASRCIAVPEEHAVPLGQCMFFNFFGTLLFLFDHLSRGPS